MHAERLGFRRFRVQGSGFRVHIGFRGPEYGPLPPLKGSEAWAFDGVWAFPKLVVACWGPTIRESYYSSGLT